jgi:hypothetical protein
MRCEPSEIHVQSNGVVHRDGYSAKEIPTMLDEKLASNGTAGALHNSAVRAQRVNPPGLMSLLFSVGGIYASL